MALLPLRGAVSTETRWSCPSKVGFARQLSTDFSSAMASTVATVSANGSSQCLLWFADIGSALPDTTVTISTQMAETEGFEPSIRL